MLDTNAIGTTDEKLEWIQIECGQRHTVGLTRQGEVFSWGDNIFGPLGHGDEEDRSVPTKVESLDGLVITKISCGAHHTAALTDKGEILPEIYSGNIFDFQNVVVSSMTVLPPNL